MKAYLDIVKNILGSKSHSALKTHYDKHGVNYGHKP
jgi:hypothetical protein